MTPPRSITGTFAMQNPRRTRSIIVVIVLVCTLLALFPQRYRSAVALAPSDPSALGLGGTLSQLGAGASVFGNQAAVDITIRVANGVFVRQFVIDRLGLMQKMQFKDRVAASRWLSSTVEVSSLRGGIVQIETKQRDPAFGEAMVAAYAEATRQRLAVINRQQTAYKRQVLEHLVQDSEDRLDRAQAAYDGFRLRTRYSDPASAISAIGERIPDLQAAIKAKEVELNAARQFATDDNLSVRQIVAQIDALNHQLAQQQALDPAEPNSVGRVVQQSTAGKRLERELSLALILYEGYNRYLQGTAVEDLTSSANLRVIEPPFVDTSRQINLSFAVLAILFALLGAALEFYRLRPPLEASPAR